MGAFVSLTVSAIDNPDAPNLVDEFKARSQPYNDAINDPDNTSRDYLLAYDKYQTFLDDELNNAYKILMSKLEKPQQQQLKTAQRNWIKFRDAEFDFIDNNWTRQEFGSSAGLSRGAYRSSIIRDRVLQLLNYAKNYS
jgi:uncharacterized protein YecT (DUF1311 family)